MITCLSYITECRYRISETTLKTFPYSLTCYSFLILPRYTFNFDAKKIDYNHWISYWIFGYRKFILKQGDESLPMAKRKYMMLYYIDFVTKLVFIGLLDFLIRKLPIWEMIGLSNF